MITAIGVGMSKPVAVPVASATDRLLDERFVELKPRLLAAARSLVGSDTADDVVQDAYLRRAPRSGRETNLSP
jgi:DNA-directed RNA polymerase specialized sigma24 family protein